MCDGCLNFTHRTVERFVATRGRCSFTDGAQLPSARQHILKRLRIKTFHLVENISDLLYNTYNSLQFLY